MQKQKCFYLCLGNTYFYIQKKSKTVLYFIELFAGLSNSPVPLSVHNALAIITFLTWTKDWSKFCILLSHLKLRRDISHAVNIAIVSIATRCWHKWSIIDMSYRLLRGTLSDGRSATCFFWAILKSRSIQNHCADNCDIS